MSLQTRLTALATAIGADIKALNGKVTTATKVLDPWHVVGAAGEIAFQPGSSATGGEIAPAFRKDIFGRVQLRGTVTLTTPGAVAFVLPLGYRPLSGRVRTTSINNQGASAWGQVNVGTDGTVTCWFDTLGGVYVSLDQIEFDTTPVTELSVLVTGAAQASVPLEPWQPIVAPMFTNNWVAGTVAPRFRKNPFGQVKLSGLIKNGTIGSSAITLPPGYRPTQTVEFLGSANGAAGGIAVTAAGLVLPFNGSNTYVALDEIEFDTELVTTMPAGPQGPKGDPGGIVVATTLDWNTAITPNFYRSVNDPTNLQKTLNAPGDPLVPPKQAGVVTAHENGQLVQRVWDLDSQVAYSRYRLGTGTWSAWIPDLAKTRLDAELSFGGANPKDGDLRYFQNAAMKAVGVLWRFRYDGSAPVGKPPWCFDGGSAWEHNIPTSETRANVASGDLATVGPNVTLPLSGDYDFEWGARMQLMVAGAAEGWSHMAIGAAFPLSSTAVASVVPTAQYGGGTTFARGRASALEGDIARMKYATQGSLQFAFSVRWMKVTPVRVAL